MTFEFGMNVDPYHWRDDVSEPAGLIAGDGFRSSRNALVLGREELYQRYELELADRGIVPHRCLTGQSFTDQEVEENRFRDRIAWWNEKLGVVRGRWEAGNEPEEGGGSASWTLSKQSFGMLLAQARDALGPDAFLISGGLVRGDPNWLRDIPEVASCDAKGIHFYEMRPDLSWPSPDWGHGALVYPLEEMNAAFDEDGIPWAVTEFGGHRDWFDDEIQRAQFHMRTLQRLSTAPFIEWVLVYGLDVVMNPEYGLRDNGQAFESYRACANFAQAIQLPALGGGDAVGQTLEQFISKHQAKLGKIWVSPQPEVIKRVAVTDHHVLVEYIDNAGETWVTPLKQDDSFFT